ncbi:hypothetical protein [Labrenzia sp. VG12]|uniref:hypothetical protein n=1 Tax=Labrenzia sp. VG12 TaxID=2021862 RepID=UPI000B8BDEAA|nr:hypothetical protein [Labrenzia sp. VG12]ASP33616.1 hypothetical protein CHH27_10465 [Labrenzia sp. VG12]
MQFLKSTALCLGLALSSAAIAAPASAQGMPPEQIKQILDLTKANWVAFRDWQGQELIYFTHLESWKCGIDYVFYGLNDGPIDQEWELEACNPDNPNAVLKEKPYLERPAGSTQSISVQLIFPDGTKSQVERFEYKPQ